MEETEQLITINAGEVCDVAIKVLLGTELITCSRRRCLRDHYNLQSYGTRLKAEVPDFGDSICVKSLRWGNGYRTYHKT